MIRVLKTSLLLCAILIIPTLAHAATFLNYGITLDSTTYPTAPVSGTFTLYTTMPPDLTAFNVSADGFTFDVVAGGSETGLINGEPALLAGIYDSTGTYGLTLASNGTYQVLSASTFAVVDMGTYTTYTPEPSSFVLLGTGVLSLAAAARRKLRR